MSNNPSRCTRWVIQVRGVEAPFSRPGKAHDSASSHNRTLSRRAQDAASLLPIIAFWNGASHNGIRVAIFMYGGHLPLESLIRLASCDVET